MNKRPLVWVAVWWVAGSAAAAGLSSRGALLAAGAGALLALGAWLSRRASWQLAAVCAAAMAIAAGERMWADARNVTALPDLMAAAEAEGPLVAYAAEADGIIVSAVDVDGDRVRFRFEAEEIRLGQVSAPRQLRERLQVTVRLYEQPDQATAAALQRGDRVRIAGELTLPAGATNSGGFDYRRYLSSQRIHWLLSAKGIDAVTETAPGPGWSAAALLGRVDAVRASLGARMDELYPEKQSGYMKGLVLGIREDLDPGQFQQFSRLGLTHILAISGLHVAVFMYVLGGMLRFARMPRERAMTVLMAAVPLYVLLSGASPSVMRAGIMAMLGLAAARLGKLKDGLHLLSAAAVVMLGWDPFLLEDVSFQLSYIVTLGLITGVAPVRRLLPKLRKGNALLDGAVVALVAGLVSFPLSIYYFNQYNLASIPVNFVLVPIISFAALPLGAASLAAAAVWPQGGKLLARLASVVNEGSFAVVEWLDKAAALRTIWATPPLWWVAAALGLAGASFALCNKWASLRAAMRLSEHGDDQTWTEPVLPSSVHTSNDDSINDPVNRENAMLGNRLLKAKRRLYLLLAALACSVAGLLAYGYMPDAWSRSATVSFLDVGQGDAILVRTAEGKHMLIDGGGTISYRKPGEEWKNRRDPFEVGSKVVVPLLMKRGVRELDVLVVSHLDSDHIRGLQAVLAAIPVKEIWWNGTLKKSEDTEKLFKAATAANIPIYAVHSGMKAALDPHSFVQVLWPKEGAQADRPLAAVKDQNNISVVLAITMYNATFVFAGDIDMKTERQIIGQAGIFPASETEKPAVLLKIAHHGSRFSTSEQWLSYWSPIGAVASVGASNSYGHPHRDVIGRVEAARALLWRTDMDGEIRFRMTHDGINVYK